jgi:hypothetical protein
MCLKHFGHDNPNMIRHAKRVAKALEHLGCWQAALPYRVQVAAYFRKVRDAFDEERLRAERHLARNLSESPHKDHQYHARKIFHEVLTHATEQCALGIATHTSLTFYVMPYIDHLRTHEMFDEGCSILIKLLETPSLLERLSEEDLEDMKYQLDDCRERVVEPQDPWFAFYEEDQDSHPIVSKLEEGYSGFPTLRVSVYVAAVFDWERRARAVDAHYPGLQPSLPAPPPWQPCSVVTKRNSLMTVLSRTEVHTRSDTSGTQRQNAHNKRKRLMMFRRAKSKVKSVIASITERLRTSRGR